jgi:hypothetical protein
MRSLRHLLYPSASNVRSVLPWALLSALISGSYGALHNQLTYTISKEYFTRFKFHQFLYLDWDLPERVLVAAIGFQAAWPIGGLIGWFFARHHFLRNQLTTERMWHSLTAVCGGTIAGLALGALSGYLWAYVLCFEQFLGWEQEFSGEVLQRFTVVACIHNAGYLGALVGVILARVAARARGVRRAPT